MDKKILKRIKKLLAMSEDTSSEHEAEIAQRRLHTLLAKYNISLESVKDHDEMEISEDVKEDTAWPWKRSVYLGISYLYFCQAYFMMSRKNYCYYFIAGADTNRMIARNIIDRTIRSIERQARQDCLNLYGGVNSRFITSFRNAAAHRVYHRCAQMIREAKKGELKDPDGNTLPVLASVYDKWQTAIETYLKRYKMTYTDDKVGRIDDPIGGMMGDRAGNSVSLNTSLQAKSGPKLLKG